MKSPHTTELARALVKFFQEYLPKQKGGSAHTVRSYRDALVLLLQLRIPAKAATYSNLIAATIPI
jgi:site-specific recombinase XerC